MVVTWVGSLIGYYYDAKYIDTLDVEYSPHRGIYRVLRITFTVGAFVAVPVYAIRRLRHVGIPLFEKKRL